MNIISRNSSTFFGGFFEQGDVGVNININTHSELRNILGRGFKTNYNDWFQAYNFLSYSDNLNISRVCSKDSLNAVAEYPKNDPLNIRIDNPDDLEVKMQGITLNQSNFLKIFARNPGSWGNDISVMIIDRKNYTDNVFLENAGYAKFVFDYIDEGEFGVLVFHNNDLTEQFVVNLIPETKKYIENINHSSKLLYIKFLMTLYDGNLGFYDGSKFIIDGNIDLSTVEDIADAFKISFFNSTKLQLKNGTTETPILSDYNEAYELAKDTNLKIDYIIANEFNFLTASEISETRADCITFTGCPRFFGTHEEKLQQTIDFRMNNLGDFKHTYLVSNYKKILNSWNQKITFVNLAGDVAGIRSKTDKTASKWSASAGEDRGELVEGELDFKINYKELGHLYNKNINSFISTYKGKKLFGNKVCVSFESPLNRLNIRNLVNDLSRNLEHIMNNFIFENLDIFLKMKINSVLRTYLEDVKVSRGIEDYFIRIEEENNTIVIDVLFIPRNIAEFVQVRVVNLKGDISFQSGSGI